MLPQCKHTHEFLKEAAVKRDDVEQIKIGLNNDQIGIRIKCTDIANQKDFYIVKVQSPANAFPAAESRCRCC